MWEMQVHFLGGEDPLEKGMATHSSILASETPWTDCSLVGYSPWGCKELDTTERLALQVKRASLVVQMAMKETQV